MAVKLLCFDKLFSCNYTVNLTYIFYQLWSVRFRNMPCVKQVTIFNYIIVVDLLITLTINYHLLNSSYYNLNKYNPSRKCEYKYFIKIIKGTSAISLYMLQYIVVYFWLYYQLVNMPFYTVKLHFVFWMCSAIFEARLLCCYNC